MEYLSISDDEWNKGSLVGCCSSHHRFHRIKVSQKVHCCGFEFERNGTKDVEIIGSNRAERYRGSGRGTVRRLCNVTFLSASQLGTRSRRILHVDALEKRLAGSSYWF